VTTAAPGRQQQTMRAIINQKPPLPRLPELRNLGTVLRILLAVNGLALVVAFDREPRFEGFSAAWLDTTSIVEPHLLAKMPDHDLWMTFFRDSEGNLMGLMSEVRR